YNRSAASFLGLTREDIGQPASNALPFWQRLGNGKLADLSPLTVPAAASYGERCQLQMTSAMLQDAKGIRRGWMLVFYDVTEHADLVDSLVAARQEADAANKAKSDFVANMSHEIRTPLQGVIGFNELLAATSLDEQQRSFLQMAAQSAAQLLSVLNDVLDFSRIEAGKMSFDPEATDISKLVEEAVNGFVPAAARKGIALNLQSELQSAEKIHVDPMRLLQVLNNLIGNAVKFTDEGHVTVTLRLLEPMVEIRIADTGVGISSQEQARLFNPFVQADGSMARKYGGTGLGLVISKRLLEQMDGAITLSSEPDKGTVCTVRIPLAKAEAEPGAKFQQNKLSPGQFSAERHVLPEFSGTIIVADDVPDNLALLDYMLKMILPNATIELRGDGQSVLTSLAAMTADLVLLDVQMPVMGGLEVARAIKASPVWCKIPVIALSAATHQQARDACVDAGMDDFLSKPVSMQALSRLLARYLCAKGPVTI
ncbi:MAG: response regulator, partial [Spirochaetaceae bacterium]